MKKELKKGFTLVELIAVIAILSLLIGLSSGIFINVRKNILDNQYKNLISYIETKAVEYANATGITTVSVEKLIEEGFLSPDDETDIYDPRNKKSLNCYLITSIYENGEYIATFKDKDIRNNNGKCNSYEETSDLAICYYNSDKTTCNKFENNTWFKDNVTLGIIDASGNVLKEDDGYTFAWSSSSGVSGTESTINVNAGNEKVLKDYYRATTMKENISNKAFKLIQIDSQPPGVMDISYDEGWTVNKKDVQITVSDYIGSGVDGIYVSNNNEKCTSDLDYKEVENNIYTFSATENGTYYICVKDKAGNFSKNNDANNKLQFVINTIDSAPNDPIITANDGITSGGWHSQDKAFNLSFNSTTKGSTPITYYHGTNPLDLTEKGNSKQIKVGVYNTPYYVKACNPNNLCSNISQYIINKDEDNPTVEKKSLSSSTSKGPVTLNYILKDASSGVMQYAIIKDKTQPEGSDWVDINGTPKSYNLTYTATKNGVYYIWTKDIVGHTSYKTVAITSIDDEGPVVNVTMVSKGKHSVTQYYNCSGEWPEHNGRSPFHFTLEIFDDSDIVYPYKLLVWKYSSTPTSEQFETNGYTGYFNDRGNGTATIYVPCDCCGDYERSYVWVKVSDELGNETIKEITEGVSFKCTSRMTHCSAWEGSDDDDDEERTWPAVWPGHDNSGTYNFCDNENMYAAYQNAIMRNRTTGSIKACYERWSQTYAERLNVFEYKGNDKYYSNSYSNDLFSLCNLKSPSASYWKNYPRDALMLDDIENSSLRECGE